jgi:hypothetical protein
VLAHLLNEPELSTAGPLDVTLDFDPDDARDLEAALAYDAVPECAERWIPARRRPQGGLPVA